MNEKELGIFKNAIIELNNSFNGKKPTTKEGKLFLKTINKYIAKKVKIAIEKERMRIARKLAKGMTKEAVIRLICREAIQQQITSKIKKEVQGE